MRAPRPILFALLLSRVRLPSNCSHVSFDIYGLCYIQENHFWIIWNQSMELYGTSLNNEQITKTSFLWPVSLFFLICVHLEFPDSFVTLLSLKYPHQWLLVAMSSCLPSESCLILLAIAYTSISLTGHLLTTTTLPTHYYLPKQRHNMIQQPHP